MVAVAVEANSRTHARAAPDRTVALWLFVPFTVLPAVLWWAIPIAVTAWAIWRLRPAPVLAQA